MIAFRHVLIKTHVTIENVPSFIKCHSVYEELVSLSELIMALHIAIALYTVANTTRTLHEPIHN